MRNYGHNLTIDALNSALTEWPYSNRNEHDERFAQYIARVFEWYSREAYNIECHIEAYTVIANELYEACPWELQQ